MKFSIITLGCKVNSYESSYVKEEFESNGYTEVDIDDNPDIVVINTCSVTNQSDAKSRHMIRQVKRKVPNALIVACGCSVQNHKDEFKDLGADILLGNFGKSKIVSYVEEYNKNKSIIVSNYEVKDDDFEHMFVKNELDKTRAFVKIQDGCNNYCSYCIIPYLRGNIRSKDIDIATDEINRLVDMGHKEVVLTGIHTGSYGRGKGYDLVDLIRRISLNPKLERIRISSIEVTELDDKFLEELKNNSKICNHLHIPLQSGSDTVLKYMNRKYDTKYFKEKIDDIRKIRPDISITTDLILGFPHESEECFEETYSFLNDIKFTKIHTFPFSLRSGTAAEGMKKYFVEDKVKKERVKKVLELSDRLENEYYNKFVDKTLSIIVENDKHGRNVGHTSNYILVEFDKKLDEGTLANIKIISVDGKSVKGELVNIEKR